MECKDKEILSELMEKGGSGLLMKLLEHAD